MKSGFFETKEDQAPKVKHDSTLKKLVVSTVSSSDFNRQGMPETYDFGAMILRYEQHERTVIVVTADRKVRVLVNAGFPDIAEIWGLWDHRMPDWLRNEMKRVHDEEFPK